MKSYKPKLSAIQKYAIIQQLAKDANKTILEMAQEMGYSCGYEWMANM